MTSLLHGKKAVEPKGSKIAKSKSLLFCVQKHDARRLHYDFRLQMGDTLKSWAVPKGPSLDPRQKRLAIEVEDHPLDYARFEGTIPEGYGAGEVIVWDMGEWTPIGDTRKGLKAGHLNFTLNGKKLKGSWSLVRTRSLGQKNAWLLIKRNDSESRREDELKITDQNQSVLSGRLLSREDGTECPRPVEERYAEPTGHGRTAGQ